MQQITQDNNTEIRVDTIIKTDNKVKYNRPDIVVFDNKNKIITIAEIGIASINCLSETDS